MKAITVEPGRSGSMRVEEIDDPVPGEGELLVEGLVLGVCGTDRELNAGDYGWAPEGADRLVIGHESLGRVISAPEGSEFQEGDLIVGVVRRPDPEPCQACAHGDFDMCRNGDYRERGIKEIHGFGSQRWVVDQRFAVKVDPELGHGGALLEPASVVAKAWDQVEQVGARAWFGPATAVVVGAGPIGLLASLIGVQKGLDVHVVDRVEEGLKPDLIAQLGATYHSADVGEVLDRVRPDVVIETTGAEPVLAAVLARTRPYAIVCLLGMGVTREPSSVPLASTGRDMVLNNAVLLGSVNANVRHWEMAAEALAAADKSWLGSLITRTVPLSDLGDAFEPQEDDIKVIVDLQA
ncbi:glucose 1-dehydrogenase [Gulosibacter sp. 10]|uniref:glucose 1-dehydrogenase n=1 Tax=Gulosibacter sp. 10 TaxID=1255570 RepID=UPI00097EB715|nr:glucose 1-dehydrogenase [Gulosibacter sp. 10]SJM70811.1 Glucose 1-dehydrogenase [Gulosibacter sp. 10]